MQGVLVDSSVLLDVFENDPVWADWSEAALATHSDGLTLFVNPVIYAEVSIGFQRIEELEEAFAGFGMRMLPIPKEALFLAGKAFLQYRRSKASPLPDFFIGAHAAIDNLLLLTQNVKQIKTCFPTIKTISP